MRTTIIAIGKVKPGPERELIARYETRFRATGKTLGISAGDLIELGESRASKPQQRSREEATRLLAAIPPSAHVIALDERGKNISSPQFAKHLRTQLEDGCKDLVLLIGGADGHGEMVRQRADMLLSFGQLTWPHQVVRLMLCEQLYRAATILTGHPYHRA